MNDVALITGASRGIGRALAIAFARIGFDVICVARDEEGLSATAQRVRESGRQAFVVPADLGSPDAIKKIGEWVDKEGKKIRTLVFLAAPTPDAESEATLQGTDQSRVDAYMHTIFRGGMLLTKELESSLASARPSSVIFIASDWALRGAHGPPVFSAAKAGLAHFARSIRRDFAEKGIAVSVIFPGDIASYDLDWNEAKWDIDDPVNSVRAELGDKRIPLIEIAEICTFIATRKNSRIEEVVVAPLSGEYDY